ncbi:DUF1508 domain-containing protein [Lysobacter capsici]
MREAAKAAPMLRRKIRFALKAGNHETILTSELTTRKTARSTASNR